MHQIGFHRTARRRAQFARQKCSEEFFTTGTFNQSENASNSDRRGWLHEHRDFVPTTARSRTGYPLRKRDNRVLCRRYPHLRLPCPAHMNRSNRSRETRQMGQVSGGSFRAQR